MSATSPPRHTPPPAALQAQALSVTLGHGRLRRTVISGLHIHLRSSRWTAVVGPNGAGKSTLLRALAGLIPSQGQISLMARPLSEWRPRERARTLSWLAQGGAADHGTDDLKVEDVVMLGRLPHQGWLSVPTAQDHQAVHDALSVTGAVDWKGRNMGSLSGGERQRVLLARQLAVQSQVLLMDEPLANLDAPHQADWLTNVRQLVDERRTVVTVLHEISVALMADDLLVMHQGQCVYLGPASQVEARQALQTVFDGRLRFECVQGLWIALPH